jgi:hypothetical protein
VAFRCPPVRGLMAPSEGLTVPRSIELPADTIGLLIVNDPGE